MARKPRMTNAARSEARERVLVEALSLLSEQGYVSTTVKQVAEQSGHSESFISWNFGSKDALFAEAIERGGERIRPARRERWLTFATPQDREQRLAQNLFGPGSTAGSDHWRLGLILALERSDTITSAAARYLAHRGEVRAMIGDWWARALDPAALRDAPEIGEIMTFLTIAVLDGRNLTPADEFLPRLRLAELASAGLCAVATALERGLLALPSPARVDDEQDRTYSAHALSLEGREAIQRATERALVEGGIGHATISRICDYAGLPASSVYWFYESKDQLLASVITDATERWLASRNRVDRVCEAEPARTARRILHADESEPTLSRCLMFCAMHSMPSGPLTDAAVATAKDIQLGMIEDGFASLAISDAAQRSHLRAFQLLLHGGLLVASQVQRAYARLSDFAPVVAHMVQAAPMPTVETPSAG